MVGHTGIMSAAVQALKQLINVWKGNYSSRSK
jgi:hypothetical protein